MAQSLTFDHVSSSLTDGRIATINLESARRGAWARFWQHPDYPGIAEEIIDRERLALQFLGDVKALDRLEALAAHFAEPLDTSFRAALIQADIASMGHRFEDARGHLQSAASAGAPSEAIERLTLTIDQACGRALDDVLARRRTAAKSGRFEDLVPLGAVLADLERFGEAEAVLQQALQSYDGVSPVPPAWACFHLGMLWGELVPEPDADLAARWYGRALEFVPGYVKARVHLSEVYMSAGRITDAEDLLASLHAAAGDPEVAWRLADILFARGKLEEARVQFATAQAGFEELLEKHLLAFADHAAEFYAASGNDLPRALELLRIDAQNRPTRRALERLNSITARHAAK